jgi:hypothetical protein
MEVRPMGERFYKRMFLIGALWNLLGGVAIVLATPLIFGIQGLKPPQPRVYYDSWIALFMTFGIGYWIVSRELLRNRPIVVLGIIGKLAFSAIFIYGMLTLPGEIPRLFWIPVVGDLIFAILFWMFLRYSRNLAPRV